MKQLFTILFLILNSLLYAQSNYQSGFVITNKGDTLKGYINAREWTISPKFIDFKATLTDGKSIKYNPVSIKRFQVGNEEIFISYIGSISLNPVNLNELQEKADTSTKLDTTFIKQITGGNNISLFKQTDDIKTRFFIAGMNEQPVELRNFTRIDENHNVITNSIFKGELILLANKYKPGNEGIVNKINNASFNQSDLVEIVNRLNDVQFANSKKAKYRLYIGAGVDYTITDFTVTNTNYSGITPRLNIGIDLFDNPDIQKIIFRFDVSFFYVTPKFDHFTYFGEPLYSSPNATYSYNQLNMSIGAKILYNFYNKPNLKLFIGAGFGLIYANYSNNIETYNGLGGNLQTTKDPFTLEGIYSNFPIETGVVLNKKIELNFTYTPSANYSTYGNFKATNQVNSIGIKYFLGR